MIIYYYYYCIPKFKGKIMGKNKTYILKNIPDDLWRKFKIKILQQGDNKTISEVLMELVKGFVNGKKG